ncbi:MAG: DUF1887 family CARF protein [Planctomycetota bacterium]|nr:DUF1887 family CARF protein [Planctomycetota bacterium]
MNILLCLISDQHVPNLLSVHALRPDRIVLLVSQRMSRRGTDFLEALRQGGLDYLASHDVVGLESEDSFPPVRKALQQAYALHPTAQWSVNLTGGTKPMSIAAHEFFKALGGNLLYTSLSQPNQLLNLSRDERIECTHRLTITEFLAGYGYLPRKASQDIADDESRARRWWQAARSMALHSQDLQVLNFDPGATVPPESRNSERDKARKKARDKGLSLPSAVYRPAHPDLAVDLAAAFELTPTASGEWIGKIDKYGVDFLLGRWLEVFLWGLLDRHGSTLNLDDVRLGFAASHGDAQTFNDFDISFMHRQGLCLLECKTGEQEHDTSFDILYKLEAILSGIRALRTRSWLAVTTRRIYGPDGQLKPHIADRTALYNCTIIGPDAIAELARNPDDAALLRKTLFPVRSET